MFFIFSYVSAKRRRSAALQTLRICLFLLLLPLLGIAEESLEQKLQQRIHYSADGPNNVGYIAIDDWTSGINQSTWLYVKNALEHYQKSKPIFLILKLNTPGGEVFAAQKISDAFKELDIQYDIPVIAFIDHQALSAGAMLAYSCRFIAIVSDASMGAAEPVISGTEGKMESASEKVNSFLRADFANRALFFGRNPDIAEAMVDKDIILVKRDGKVLKLDNESQIILTGSNPDVVISPKGKLLTLNAKQLMEYHVADLLLPTAKFNPITEEERAKGSWSGSKMLLFQAPFFSSIPNVTIDEYQSDWKVRFFSFLSLPIISSLLVIGVMVGFYMEINTPGFGLAGGVAITCLVLIILSSFSLQLIHWLDLIILVAGIVIILVELFVLPTFGFLGFVGIILFLVGLLSLMLPALNTINFEFDTKTFNAAGEMFMERLTWLIGAIIVSILIAALLGRFVLPRFSAFRRFILQDDQVGYIAGENPATLPIPGTHGKATTTLRPAGQVWIQDRYYDAVSDGTFIEQGTAIVVLRHDGSILVVTRADTKVEIP